jgi:hypothetical protein
MPVEDLEYLGDMLSIDELDKWAGYGYSGESYVAIMEDRVKNKNKEL